MLYDKVFEYYPLLFRLLGQGAFGEVYEGSLKNLCANVKELPVAVKVSCVLWITEENINFPVALYFGYKI